MSDILAANFHNEDDWLQKHLRQGSYVSRKPVKPHKRQLLTDVAVRPHPTHAPKLNRANYSQFNSHNSSVPSSETVSQIKPDLRKNMRIDPSAISGNLKNDSSSHLKKSSTRRLSILDRSKLMPRALLLAAVMIFIIGVYAGLSGLRINHLARAQAVALTNDANAANSSTNSSSQKSSTNPAISTVKPTKAAIANYVVAPNLPKYIIIPSLGVDARVMSVGVNASGALGTPDNVYDTAWYNESADPGAPGAMLIDGHVSSWSVHGVFYGIKSLVAGNIIKIERGDGKTFIYKVVRSQTFPSGNVNMSSAMTPAIAGQPGLNLITCAGDVIPGTSLFNERILVYATLEQ